MAAEATVAVAMVGVGGMVAVTLAAISGEAISEVAISEEAISVDTEVARDSRSRRAAFTAIPSATTAARTSPWSTMPTFDRQPSAAR